MPPLNAQIVAPDDLPPEAGPPPLAAEFLRHRAWLEALLVRRYGPDVAADIAQDTWLGARGYRSPAPIRSARALLARIALNLASKHARKAAWEVATAPDDDALDVGAIDACQEQAIFFEQMMLALPPKLRDVFSLSHVEGRTYPEIALLRGISVKTVEKRMTQAIAKCADMVRS